MKVTATLTNEQWRALATAAKLGVFVSDLIGCDDDRFSLGEPTTATAHEAMQAVDNALRGQIVGFVAERPEIEANHFDVMQAHNEGWTVDLDEAQGEWVIRRADDCFATDEQATEHVRRQAGAGTRYHEEALLWLETANALRRAADAIPPRAILQAAE
jgi:hypothetical protein